MAEAHAPVALDAHGAPGETHTSTEADHGSGGGLPQFEFQHWGGQIVYLVFLFVVLYLLIAKVFAPRMRRIFDERAATIGQAIEEARSVQEEAQGQAAARAIVEKLTGKAATAAELSGAKGTA